VNVDFTKELKYHLQRDLIPRSTI